MPIGKAGVGIAAGADGIGQEEAVEPGVDDPVAGLQGDALAGDHERRQGLVDLDVGRLRVGGRVAERLHEQVGLELEAGQLLELVGGHRPGRVLGADRGHVRLAGRAGQDARDAAGAADDLLGQRVALVRLWLGILDGREERRLAQAERLSGLGGELAADDEREAAAGPELVLERRRLDGEPGDLAAAGAEDDARGEVEGDDIARLHLGHVGHERQAAGVLGRIEEDRGDEAADDDAGPPLVGHEGDILADVPHQGVAGRLAARARADDVADEGDAVALLAEPLRWSRCRPGKRFSPID